MLEDLNFFFHAINPSDDWRIGSKEKLISVLGFETFEDNAFIIKKGKRVDKFYWLSKGAVRHYFDAVNGNERIIDIYLPGQFFTDHECHTNNGMAVTNIKSIGKAECFSIDMGKLCQLYTEIPEFAGFVMQLLVRMNTLCLSRVKMLLGLSQHERFEYVCEHQPELFQAVPLKYIAQYIGVAPESLSRLRSNYKRGMGSGVNTKKVP